MKRDRRSRLAGAFVEQDRLPANARRADVLDVRAQAQPVAHQRRRVILGFARARAAAKNRTSVNTLSYGKPSSAKSCISAYSAKREYAAKYMMPATSTSAHCTCSRALEDARARRQRVAKFVTGGSSASAYRATGIDLEIHAAAGSAVAQRRASERLGNQRDFEPSGRRRRRP